MFSVAGVVSSAPSLTVFSAESLQPVAGFFPVNSVKRDGNEQKKWLVCYKIFSGWNQYYITSSSVVGPTIVIID